MNRFGLNKLQTRLTILILILVLPPVIALRFVVADQAENLLRKSVNERLEKTSQIFATRLNDWMEMNLRALGQLVAQPDIIGMNADEQKPVLETMAAAYPHMYLVSTTDVHGINVARNDDVAPKDYSDRAWYQEAVIGNPITFQTLIGKTSGQPALVVSTPIRDATNAIVGVGMFATDLTKIASTINVARVGETGFAYLVNDKGEVLAHPDPAYTDPQENKLVSLADAPPVQRVLDGHSGFVEYTDQDGSRWLARVQVLNYGWGLVVQQKTSEAFAPLHTFQRISWIGMGFVAIIVLVFTWLVTRRTLRPINALTKAAIAIGQGDLDQTVSVETDDELGILARTFNAMTARLNRLVTSLETQVAERTAELSERAAELEASNRVNQRRAAQLAASAQVARSIASVLDPDELLQQVVHLIADQFGYYHVGVFLVDESGEWAVLQASNSEGGQRMLARAHRLGVGQRGIVGETTFTGKPHIARDVGVDAVYFDNPDLPETRSEIALPLVARGQIIGALDVQSKQEDAFDEQDIAILGTLADQIAVALDNARLYRASQSALAQLQTIQQQYLETAWRDFYAQRAIDYFEYRAQPRATRPNPTADHGGNGQPTTIEVPIKIRDQIIGTLGLHDEEARQLSADEIALIQAVADQVAQAMDSARLFDDTRRRAQREQLVAQISDRVRSAPDIDSMLRLAVQEIRRVLGVSHGAIRLGTETHLKPPEITTVKHDATNAADSPVAGDDRND